MNDFKNELNASQLAAVKTTIGPVLVIAGAGSGKTRVIEYRVRHLIQQGIDPQSILLLTFTRKAANEMLSRGAQHDSRCLKVDGGTFHAFAFRLLKKYGPAIGLARSFSILDEDDAGTAIQKSMAILGFTDNGKRFPKKSTLRSIISMSINKGKPIEDVLDREYPHFLEYAKTIDAIRKEYAAYKVRKNYLDYDDLLIYLKLLLKKDEIRPKVANKYKYIMVDEYQDTNRLQADIIYLLASGHNNVMAVGDDAQSIYGFRGTSHENIMDFPKRFAGCIVIKLEENYRSTQPILDVANAVLENVSNKYSKSLVAARGDAEHRPHLLYFKDVYEEAAWVAAKIKEFRDEDVPLSGQAVLFRSAYISIPLQAELGKLNIPYQVFGGLKFYETAHVKDLISHMRVVSNPKDELSWHRILTLIEGVGPKTADKITEEITACASLGEAIDKVLAAEAKKYSYSARLKALGKNLKEASGEEVSVADQYEGLLSYYLPLMKDKFDDWHIRINDLEALKQITTKYKSLEQFLADFSIEPPDRGVAGVDPSVPDDEKPITLSTIHSAKGLEWDTVFLIGLADGALPISFALNKDEDIEEEHRLFYVALTRAKNKLFLSLHHEGSRGGLSQFNKISRFVDAPNVLSVLEQKAIAGREFDSDFSLNGNDISFERGADHDTLLADIIDSFD